MHPLLLAICYLLTYGAPAQTIKPRQIRISNQPALFEKLMRGFDSRQLLQRYRTELKLIRVTRNRQEPTVSDSLLKVKTPADELILFKNQYNTILREASITSTKIRFAGLCTGATQADFCRTLRLKPGYDQYIITDGVENFVQLTFAFANGKLKSVAYRELVNMDAID